MGCEKPGREQAAGLRLRRRGDGGEAKGLTERMTRYGCRDTGFQWCRLSVVQETAGHPCLGVRGLTNRWLWLETNSDGVANATEGNASRDG